VITLAVPRNGHAVNVLGLVDVVPAVAAVRAGA